MKLEINGQTVEVDDSFAKLPPDQQQATVESIASQLSAKPGVLSKAAEKIGMEVEDPFLWGGVGTIGGLVAGPAISEAYRGATGQRTPAASPAAGASTTAGAPGQKWAAKTGFGEGPGYTVKEVSEEFKGRRAPVGEGKISKNIPKNKPLSIAEYQAQKAREEMEARMRAQALEAEARAQAKATPMAEKLSSRYPKTMGAVTGAASRFPAWLARGAAGAATGYQGADALRKLNEGNITGGILSGIGALGSGLSFIPHPITRIGGTALALGAPALESFLSKKEEPTEGVANPMAAGGLAGYATGGLAGYASGGLAHMAGGGKSGALRNAASWLLKDRAADDLGVLRLRHPVTLADEARLSGFTTPEQNVFYGYTKTGQEFTVPREYVDPAIILKSRDKNKTADFFKESLIGYKPPEFKEGGKTPAWQRKEGQNPEGGLNAAGRASYKRETGGELKPPVSAKEAKNSPAKAARRKSFCARMSGMPGPMKDENGKPTRKALALRKWDC